MHGDPGDLATRLERSFADAPSLRACIEAFLAASLQIPVQDQAEDRLLFETGVAALREPYESEHWIAGLSRHVFPVDGPAWHLSATFSWPSQRVVAPRPSAQLWGSAAEPGSWMETVAGHPQFIYASSLGKPEYAVSEAGGF